MTRSVVMVVLLALFLAPYAAFADQPADPGGILAQLEAAIASRKITQLSALFSDDFQQEYVSTQGAARPINKAKCTLLIDFAIIWLEHPKMAPSLSFQPGYRIVQVGDDRWQIEDLVSELMVAEGGHTVIQRGVMEVERVVTPKRLHYQVSHWTVHL